MKEEVEQKRRDVEQSTKEDEQLFQGIISRYNTSIAECKQINEHLLRMILEADEAAKMLNKNASTLESKV